MDSSDKEEPERPIWPHRRPHMEYDDGDYEQNEVVELEQPTRRKRALRRPNPIIDAEIGVDKDASGN